MCLVIIRFLGLGLNSTTLYLVGGILTVAVSVIRLLLYSLPRSKGRGNDVQNAYTERLTAVLWYTVQVLQVPAPLEHSRLVLVGQQWIIYHLIRPSFILEDFVCVTTTGTGPESHCAEAIRKQLRRVCKGTELTAREVLRS